MYGRVGRSLVGLPGIASGAAVRRRRGCAALATRHGLPGRWGAKHYPDRAVLTGSEDLSSVLGEALHDFRDWMPVGVAANRDDGQLRADCPDESRASTAA